MQFTNNKLFVSKISKNLLSKVFSLYFSFSFPNVLELRIKIPAIYTITMLMISSTFQSLDSLRILKYITVPKKFAERRIGKKICCRANRPKCDNDFACTFVRNFSHRPNRKYFFPQRHITAPLDCFLPQSMAHL